MIESTTLYLEEEIERERRREKRFGWLNSAAQYFVYPIRLMATRRRRRYSLVVSLLAGLLSMWVGMQPRVYGEEPPNVQKPDELLVAKAGQDGVYVGIVGTIRELTCNAVVILVDRQTVLFERKLVRRITLNSPTSKEIKQTYEQCWSKEESQFVAKIWKSAQKIPIIGPVFDALDSVIARARTMIVVLIVLGLLFFAAYKLWEIFYVAAHVRGLSIDKLSMEVKKLRYDLHEVERKLGVAPQVAGSASAPVTEEKLVSVTDRLPTHLEMPKLPVLEFVKYKILRMLTDEVRQKRSQAWRTKWQKLEDHPTKRWLSYFFRQTMYVSGLVLLGMMTFTMFLVAVTSLGDPEMGVPGGLGGLFWGFIFLVVFLRLIANYRIMREAYHETFEQPPAAKRVVE